MPSIHSWMLTLVQNWPGTAPLFSSRDDRVVSPTHMPSMLDTFWWLSKLTLTKISVIPHFTEKKTETQIEWWTCHLWWQYKQVKPVKPLCCFSDQSYLGWLPAHQWFADILKSTFLLPIELGCPTSARFSSESIYALSPCASHLLVWS